MDESLYDKSNCIGVLFTEKFKFGEMKQYLEVKIEKLKFDRLKSKIDWACGRYWTKKLTNSEWIEFK